MGYLGAPFYIGAIAVGGMIFNFIFWGFGFLRMSSSGLTAQAVGQVDVAEVVATVQRGTLLALLLAAVVIALQGPIMELALFLVDGSSEVNREAGRYFSIRVWSTPATLVNFVIAGWLLGLQKTRLTLLLALFGNGLNVLLDLLLVVAFDLATTGVAMATVVAEYATLLLGLWLIWRQVMGLGEGFRQRGLFAGRAVGRLLTLNRDIFIRTFCLVSSFALLTALGARQGDVILAANALLLNFYTLMAYGLDGLAHACESLVGRAVGSGDREQLSRVVRATFGFSLLVALVFSGLFLVAGQLILNLLTDLPEVRVAAARYLPWVIVAPVVAVWCYVLDGIFIGATLAREMRNTMLFSVLLFGLMAPPLLAWWGNHGLWLAFTLFMALRGLSLGVFYARVPRGLNSQTLPL